MSNLTRHRENSPLALPEPRTDGAVSIRTGLVSDLKFIDEWQKKHSKMVGWISLPELEKNIKKGNILIAEVGAVGAGGAGGGRPVGYIFYKDTYFKREDCGVCYQLNVVPGSHRKLIGASLVKAAFERCPYGVKLFCCWCAQDLEANHFWESIGFVPLAFRAGSRGKAQGGRRSKGRLHIFWQRRIREGDETTPYWYPSETNGGAMKEARIVLPIPVDKHWSEDLPLVLPGIDLDAEMNGGALPEGPKEKKPRVKKVAAPVPSVPSNSFGKGGLRFGPPTPPGGAAAVEAKPKKEKRPKQKNDPRHLIVAREVRDRYLDEINSGRLLPSATEPKYEVGRSLRLESRSADDHAPVAAPHLLNAA